MIIIIKSTPYQKENALGALFLGLSVGEAEVPTKVIFVESGLNCLIAGQNPDAKLSMPPISDLIMQLIGIVNFYAIPSKQPNFWFHLSQKSNKILIIPGIKTISYEKLADFIIDDPNIAIL
ncbi:MAG: hypothetical protein ACTSWL_00410 [Promethearchaeota archaeon]